MAITAAELAQLQADAGQWRTETCEIQRLTRTQTDTGGYSESYATVATVSCRRTPDIIPPVEREQAGRVQASLRWWITLPAETDVRSTDKLLIAGRAYQVLAAGDRTIEIERRVLALELT